MDRSQYRRAAVEFFRARLAQAGLLGGDERRAPLRGRLVVRDDGKSGRARRAEAQREGPVGEVLRSVTPRAVLVARGGAGKTTALLQYALALAASEDGPLPVFVPLRQLEGGFSDLEALIGECGQRVLAGAAVDLRDGAWVLLFDGVNERRSDAEPFARLLDKYPRVPMIFSAREPADHLGQAVELLPLTAEERDELVAAWIPGQAAALQRRIAGDRRLEELSRTPLLLAMLCDAAGEGLAPGGARIELIRASVACHARRYAVKAGTGAHPSAQIDAWLAGLAHAMLLRGALQLEEREAEQLLRAAPLAATELPTLVRHLGAFHLLTSGAPGTIEFVHPLIHEYYAAQQLRTAGPLPGRRTLIRDYVNRTLWTEPLRLFAEECGAPATARALVEATREVDDMLAARLVGSFAPRMQPALLERLGRADDTPGTRLTRAITVGTAAVSGELARLAAEADADLRFQVADCLWDLAGAEFAAINAGLLGDASLSVVNAAAHNLRRHPAPVEGLLAALDRAELWACKPPYALPFLVRALLESDTAAAAERACALVRAHLVREDLDSRMGEPASSVRSGMFAAVPAPTVVRALVLLLAELPAEAVGRVMHVLRDSAELVDLGLALARASAERRFALVEAGLQASGRFLIADEWLLAAVQQGWRSGWFGPADRVFAAALARRCHGLAAWLCECVAGSVRFEGRYVGRRGLGPLLLLDPAAAVRAVSGALVSPERHLRQAAAFAVCEAASPALAEARAQVVALARADAELAVPLIAGPDVALAVQVLEGALAEPRTRGARRVIEAFWARSEVGVVIARLRESPRAYGLRWPDDLPEPLRRGLARSLLVASEPALTEVFLASNLWHEMPAIVVPYLEHIVATGEHAAVARALERLYEVRWIPPLATYVRLLGAGQAGALMRPPEADADALFVALRPLLRHADARTRGRALNTMSPLPVVYLGEFVALLDEPGLTVAVAQRLVGARVHAEFPGLLRRPGLVVCGRDAGAAIDEHTFEVAIEDAPAAVIGACVAILAGRAGAEWDRLLLALFRRAPAFGHHARVLAGVRRAANEAHGVFEALLRCASAVDELAVLDRWHDDPALVMLSIARAFAEVAPPAAAPLMLARLVRIVDGEEPSEHEVIRHSLAAWWAQLLAQVGTAEHAAELVGLARRTKDVWLAQTLYRTVAEIQQRTGIYHLRHTTMPRHWTLLHLSDLHFSREDQAERWHSALAEDLRRELGVARLDAIVLSGDIVDRAQRAGYAAAEGFVARLCAEFAVARERVVIVPGNHDVDRGVAERALTPVPRGRGAPPQHDFEADRKLYAITDRAGYDGRLAAFAGFFARTLGRSFPVARDDQFALWVWPELEVVVLGLSSVGELDGVRPGNATIGDMALSRALDRLRGEHDDCLKLAVFHHPLHGPGEDRLRDPQFLHRLAVAGFSLVLHGHVHQPDNSQFRYDHSEAGRRIEVVGAGTFGARASELPTGYPWQYNLLRFTDRRVRVETRRREADNTAWKPDARWTVGPGEAARAWYELVLGSDE